MERFEIPESQTFDESVKVRQSCHLIEQINDEFFCDCPPGIKGKMCKHEVGMMYKTGILEITSDVRSKPLGQKRKRGRPAINYLDQIRSDTGMSIEELQNTMDDRDKWRKLVADVRARSK